jgi:hypothetical protein
LAADEELERRLGVGRGLEGRIIERQILLEAEEGQGVSGVSEVIKDEVGRILVEARTTEV